MISVDGERDTPEVMKKYLAGYSDSFIGLTGDPKAVRKIAADFKAVFFKGLPYDNAGNYQVEHTSLIYLVDSQGRLRATFLDAPVESMVDDNTATVAPGAVARELSPCRGGRATCVVGRRRTRRRVPGHT